MDCAICGDLLPDERPYHYITLGTVGGGPDGRRIDERICEHCWEHYREKLF